MRDKEEQDGKDQAGTDLDLMLRWSPALFALVFGGLFLASRAADTYTYVFGFLLAGFGLLLGGRLFSRLQP